MSFKPSNLGKPTPKKWKRIGRAMIAAGAAGAGISLVMEFKALAVAVFAMSVLGQFITEFFADEKPSNKEADEK